MTVYLEGVSFGKTQKAPMSLLWMNEEQWVKWEGGVGTEIKSRKDESGGVWEW